MKSMSYDLGYLLLGDVFCHNVTKRRKWLILQGFYVTFFVTLLVCKNRARLPQLGRAPESVRVPSKGRSDRVIRV
jgi:hypothetical protein